MTPRAYPLGRPGAQVHHDPVPPQMTADPVANFGNSLRYLRTQRGWSQQKLEELSGVSNRMISKVERGAGCGLWAAVKLARALGAGVDAMTGTGGVL